MLNVFFDTNESLAVNSYAAAISTANVRSMDLHRLNCYPNRATQCVKGSLYPVLECPLNCLSGSPACLGLDRKESQSELMVRQFCLLTRSTGVEYRQGIFLVSQRHRLYGIGDSLCCIFLRVDTHKGSMGVIAGVSDGSHRPSLKEVCACACVT